MRLSVSGLADPVLGRRQHRRGRRVHVRAAREQGFWRDQNARSFAGIHCCVRLDGSRRYRIVVARGPRRASRCYASATVGVNIGVRDGAVASI